MKYIDEFRDINLVKKIASKIKEVIPAHNINIMEVCGTHTMSFYRFGLDKLLPENLRLISGPGCPVCVSPQEYIDAAIKLTEQKDTIILTFGDMLRIPGSASTLERKRAEFGNVRVVYSPFDSISMAKLNPSKKIIFLAVGFETTAPAIALTVKYAKQKKLRNLFFLSSLKLIPPAMGYLVQDKRLNLQGFLCPGHVSAIIGTNPYEFLVKQKKIGCCVAGFEPVDILEGFLMLSLQIAKNKPAVDNQYSRVVKKEGNPRAQKIIDDVFKPADAVWRGLGKIPGTGLQLRDEFSRFDAQKQFLGIVRLRTTDYGLSTKCKCGDILKGLITPLDCPLFSKACCPDNPVGPCMVSNEGACNAYYKYRRKNK
jgi:hydrogenase expression/formation protein HypD